MYHTYYGLTEKPFELAPDGSYVYMSETHKEGLATLRYGVIANKGFLLLTGGVGVGKTTLLNALLKMVQEKVIICLLNNPTLSKKEFFHYIANQFSLPYKNNKSNFILHFKKLLGRCEKQGEKVNRELQGQQPPGPREKNCQDSQCENGQDQEPGKLAPAQG